MTDLADRADRADANGAAKGRIRDIGFVRAIRYSPFVGEARPGTPGP